jgi:transcriptional regulator with XRE-family HTH domain
VKLELGAKLRRLREQRGLSLVEVATQSGVGAEALAAFEEQKAIPAVADLMKIARALDVSVGHFFQTRIPEERVEVVRSSERWTVRKEGGAGGAPPYRYHALSHGLTEKLMEPFLVEVPPGAARDATPSVHAGEEFLFVLAGVLEVAVGDATHRLEPGDAIYYDSRLPHTLRALEGTTARLLACVADARRAQDENPISRSYR